MITRAKSSNVGSLSDITRDLIRKFKRQRPMRSGSLLVTILGDAIAPRGGAIALSSLISLADPFGLPERLVRTTIGRLAQDGWVSGERVGRASFYDLSREGKMRFAEATQRIYAEPTLGWDAQWSLVLIRPDLKSGRESLREEMSWLGFGELSPGTFVHPTQNLQAIRERIDHLESQGKLILIEGGKTRSSAQLVALGWSFDDLARRYRRFNDMFAPADQMLGTVQHVSDTETAFVLRTLLLHEYRKVHLRDPLLPGELLPSGWPGSDAYELCRRLYLKVFSASEQYLTANVLTRAGDLPPAQDETYSRFGGLPRPTNP